MATRMSLPSFPPFEVHADGNIGHRWSKWLARYDCLLIALDITEYVERMCALLLHYAGRRNI